MTPPPKVGRWTMHPAARKVPRPSLAEKRELVADIRRNGQILPVVMHEGMVLDGFSRCEACVEIGLEPKTVKWDGAGDTPSRFVFAMAAARRHLNESQLGLLALDMEAEFLADAKARQLKAGSRGPEGASGKTKTPLAPRGAKGVRAPKSSQAVAEATGGKVSARTIERLREVQRAAPERLEDIREGRTTAKKAAAEIHRKAQHAAVRDYRAPVGLFGVIYDDPSWPFEARVDDDTHRGRTQYPAETIEQIASTPMPADKDCVLIMWATKQHFMSGEAAHVVKARGFTLRNFWTWVKTTADGKVRMGTGNWGQNCEEVLLIATRGKPVVNFEGQPTVILAPRPAEHSRKPDVFRQIIERCCPAPAKLELHAREDQRDGWTLAGAELGAFKGAA